MKFPFYQQYDVNDCAPTCVRMLCAYYRNKYGIETLRERCGISRSGVTVRNVVRGLESLGFEAQAVKLPCDKVERMPLPAILYWQQRHFVVLYKVERGRDGRHRYCIANPSFGRERLDEDTFSKAFLGQNRFGVAVLADTTEQFYVMHDERRRTRSAWSVFAGLLRGIVWRYRRGLSLSFVFVLVAMVANWVLPMLFQGIIDKGIGGRDMNVVLWLVAAQFGLFVSYTVATYLSNLFTAKANFGIGLELMGRYLHKLARLPITFFDVKINSDLIQITEDQERIKAFFTSNLPTLVLAVCNWLAFSLILLHYSGWIFLVSLVFSLLSVGWFLLFLRRQRMLEYKRFALLSEGNMKIYEMVMGMREIKMNGAQARMIADVEQNIREVNHVYLDGLNLSFYINSGLSSLSKLKDIIIVSACAWLIIKGEMTIGSMMTITYLLGQISAPLQQMLNFGSTLQLTKISLDRVDNIQSMPDENDSRKKPMTSAMYGDLRLDEASFKYAGDFPYVLHDVTCVMPKGQVTAIVGESGSGKSTLLKMLIGFYYPQQGSLTVGGIPMDTLNTEDWRKRCGIVMQDGGLFSGTLLENIAMSDEHPSLERAQAAARVACIDGFIAGLPMGYYTNVGNMGMELSGGQKQRVLIARAVYKEPDYIFLDEATSFLDVNNEREIMENLNRFFVGRTVVIIAHRLSTVRNADNIVVLEKGRIIEQGNHAALEARRGVYYHLIKEQLNLG